MPQKRKERAPIDAEFLGMIVSNLIFEMTGFGPSKAICEPFAAQVLAEAAAINMELKLS